MKTIQDLEEKCEDHRAPDEDGHPVIIRSSLARSSLRAAHVRSSDAYFFYILTIQDVRSGGTPRAKEHMKKPDLTDTELCEFWRAFQT